MANQRFFKVAEIAVAAEECGVFLAAQTPRGAGDAY
jgi:hypothetical protein